MQPEFYIKSVNGIEDGKGGGDGAEDSRRPKGNDGKGKNSVRCELQQPQWTVLRAAGAAGCAFDGNSNLPKAYPSPHAPEIAVMFGHLADFLDHPAGHEPE